MSGGPLLTQETALRPFPGQEVGNLMVPIPPPPLKRRSDTTPSPSALVWATPYLFLVPCMVAVGVVRAVAPWMREDCNQYLGRLAELLEKSLEAAVAYRRAGTVSAPSRPPRQLRAQARPGGSTRPAGKPGTPRTSRTRTKH